MRSENGRAGPPQSALSACCPPAGGGGVSGALGVAAVSNRAPPTSEQAQILPFIVSSPLLSRVSKLAPQEIKRALLRLRQPHCFGQTVLANQQIHLNPVAHAFFVHRQTQCAACAALHTYPHDGGIVHVLRQAAAQQGTPTRFAVGDAPH